MGVEKPERKERNHVCSDTYGGGYNQACEEWQAWLEDGLGEDTIYKVLFRCLYKDKGITYDLTLLKKYSKAIREHMGMEGEDG